MKEVESQPGFWKKKNYGAARLDQGPISQIKLDKGKGRARDEDRRSQEDDVAGPSSPRHGVHYESLRTYREMCTG